MSKKRDRTDWVSIQHINHWSIECPHFSSVADYFLRESALSRIREHGYLYEPLYIAMGMPETFLVNNYKTDKDGNPIKERLTQSDIAYIAKGLKRNG